MQEFRGGGGGGTWEAATLEKLRACGGFAVIYRHPCILRESAETLTLPTIESN